MKVTTTKRWNLGLALVLVSVCLSVIHLTMAIDDDEIAALEALVAHYPVLGSIWGNITSDICNGTRLSYTGCTSSTNGHISYLEWYWQGSSTLHPLGNISGLHYLRSLYMYSGPVTSIDDWYMQLPSLTMLHISSPRVSDLGSAFSANFTKNPKLSNLYLRTTTQQGTYPHNVIAGDNLRSVTLSTYNASYFPSTFLQNAPKITSLSMVASVGHSFPLCNMSALQSLTISSPDLPSFPPDFELATGLRYLYLSGSPQITKLPPALSSFTQLEVIEVQNLQLNKPDSIPSLWELKSLYKLHMINCSVSSIPEAICNTTSSNYIYIDFSDNPITSIPSCIGDLMLRTLNLGGTKLTSLPSNIFSSRSLYWVSLSGVSTLGESSATLPSFAVTPSMYWLDMSNCGLTGTFPYNIESSSSLYYLRLGGNRLTGTVPTSFFKRPPYWREFDVTGNNLTGDFPSPVNNYGSCPLYLLRLGGNQFTSFHPDIMNCTDLNILDVSGNDWDLPQPLSSYPDTFHSLHTLSVSFNPRLSSPDSSLPTFFAESTTKYTHYYNIQRVNMSGCGFTGSVPDLQNNILRYLDISHNLLTGTLESLTSSRWSNFRELDVSDNQLDGSFPPQFSSWNNLHTFKASENQLNGTIPALPSNLKTFWLDSNPNITLCPMEPHLEDRLFDSCRLSVEYPDPMDDEEKQCWDKYEAIGCTLIGRRPPPPPPPTPTPIDTSSSPSLPSIATLSIATLIFTWLAIAL